jgi:hypothetical protein
MCVREREQRDQSPAFHPTASVTAQDYIFWEQLRRSCPTERHLHLATLCLSSHGVAPIAHAQFPC